MNTNTIIAVVIGVLVVGVAGVALMGNQTTNKDTEMTSVETAKNTVPTKAMKEEAKPMAAKTIVDIAVENPDFSTLVTAVTTADLAATLSGPGPFTVFAPTNAAFAKLPVGTVEALLKDKAKLASILTYHVVSGKVLAADVVKLTTAKTVNGQSVMIKVVNGEVYVDDAKVVTTDIVASNGVIHVIDSVILPK